MKFLRLADSLGKWSGRIVAPLVSVYMLIIVFEIIVRYAFNSPTKWAHETSTFIFGAQFMLAGAYCFWRGSMVNVEILRDRFPIRVRAILDSFFFVIPLIICTVMIWKGWDYFWVSLMHHEHTGTVFGPPLYPLKAIIPISALMLFLQVVAKLVRDIHIAVTGEELK